MRPLLNGLDNHDWSKWSHAYGPATDVPELLRALLQPAERDEAISALWGNVFHQGSVWEVSAHTVPFLVEILADGPDDDEMRAFVLTYLHHLALGYPESFFPNAIDVDTYFKDAPTPCYEKDCFLAVEAAVPTYLEFVHRENPDVSHAAISLVSSFVRKASESEPKLLEVLTHSKSSATIGHALVALAILSGDDVLPECEARVSDADEELRVHAAVACAIADAERMSPEALDALVNAPDVETTFCGGDGASMTARVLARLPDVHKERAVEAIAARMAGGSPMTNLDLAATVLDLAFPEGTAPDHARDLTQMQRRAVEAVRDHAPFTFGGGTFANMSSLARNYGLGDSKESLAQWLDA